MDGKNQKLSGDQLRFRNDVRGGGGRFKIIHSRRNTDLDPEPSVVVMVLRVYPTKTFPTKKGSQFIKGAFLAGIGEFTDIPKGCKSYFSDVPPEALPESPEDAVVSDSTHPQYMVLPTKWSKDEAKMALEYEYGITTQPCAFLERRTAITFGGAAEKLPRDMRAGDVLIIKGVNVSVGWNDKGETKEERLRFYTGFRDIMKVGRMTIAPDRIMPDYTAMGLYPNHLPKISGLHAEYRFGRPFLALLFGPHGQFNSVDDDGNLFDVVSPSVRKTSFEQMFTDGELSPDFRFVNLVMRASKPKIPVITADLPAVEHDPEKYPKVQMALAFNGTINVNHRAGISVNGKRDKGALEIHHADWQARPSDGVRDRVAFDVMLYPEKLACFGIGQTYTWHRLMRVFFNHIDWTLMVTVDTQDTIQQPLNLAARSGADDAGPMELGENPASADFASSWSIPTVDTSSKKKYASAKNSSGAASAAHSVDPTCSYALSCEFVKTDAQHIWSEQFGFKIPLELAKELTELYELDGYARLMEDLEYSRSVLYEGRRPDVRSFVSNSGVACVSDSIPGSSALFEDVVQSNLKGFYAVYPYEGLAEDRDGFAENIKALNANPEEAAFLVAQWLNPDYREVAKKFYDPTADAVDGAAKARKQFPNAMWLYDNAPEMRARPASVSNPDSWPGTLPAVFAVFKAAATHDRNGSCAKLFLQEGALPSIGCVGHSAKIDAVGGGRLPGGVWRSVGSVGHLAKIDGGGSADPPVDPDIAPLSVPESGNEEDEEPPTRSRKRPAASKKSARSDEGFAEAKKPKKRRANKRG